MTCTNCGHSGSMKQETVEYRTHARPESVTYCPSCGEVDHTDPV